MKAYRGREGGIVFSTRDAYYDRHLEVPCGQCMGCRLRRSRDWAIRMMYEARDHDSSSFVTLTFAPEHEPEDFSLDVRHWQLFAKRLRKRCGPFRFFHAGEYGPSTLRPHYHACIFGLDFSWDRVPLDQVEGHQLFESATLRELWPYGFHSVGSLTFDSAAYVAKYCTKKITGKLAERAYTRIDRDTGECWSVRPEYATMSRRPGIGSRHFHKFKDEIYQHDSVIFKGAEYAPPRYFDKLLGEEAPEQLTKVQARRRKRALQTQKRDTRDKEDINRIREKIQLARAYNSRTKKID